jgi:hypothetical protein
MVAFVLAWRRPRMTVAIGAALAANALLVALALSVGRQLFVNQLSGTLFAEASRVFYDTLLAYLQRGQQALLWLGVILVVAGWFAGANKYGTAVRTSVTHGLEGTGSRVGDGQIGAAGRWVATNVAWLRAAVIVLGVVVLLWGNNVSSSRLWWSLALVLLLLAAAQVLAGAGRGAGAAPQVPPRTELSTDGAGA